MLVTVDELLGHAKKKEQGRKIKILVAELDREIEAETLSRTEYRELLLSDSKDSDCEVIYNACKIFRDDKLIESLRCKTAPYEVVGKILSANTIYALAKTILEKSDLEFGNSSKYIEVIEDDIKN